MTIEQYIILSLISIYNRIIFFDTYLPILFIKKKYFYILIGG
jgi:hypothetical protein